jgi:hypothetical protein
MLVIKGHQVPAGQITEWVYNFLSAIGNSGYKDLVDTDLKKEDIRDRQVSRKIYECLLERMPGEIKRSFIRSFDGGIAKKDEHPEELATNIFSLIERGWEVGYGDDKAAAAAPEPRHQ